MEFEIRPLSEEEESIIEEKINRYADSMAQSEACTAEDRLVLKVADDEGRVIGGCIVNIHAWGRAVLAQLWVDTPYRRQGIGSMLIRKAEAAAKEKGCYYLCLGTTDYQARGLYEKHGFTVFTVNRDIPKGHESYSLSKRLDRPVPDYVPTNNSAAERYKAVPGSKEDAGIISSGLGTYCDQFVPDGHDYIRLSKKLVDRDGNMIAAVIAGVDGDDNADIDGVWVEEPYRNRGLGSYLLGEAEREAKENGAYVILLDACDWNAGFFFRGGYAIRGELEDYPRGHHAYELEKRI